MRNFYLATRATMLLLFYAFHSNAQPPTISYQSFMTGLSAPIDIVNAGDGSNRLFIVQQDGVIWVREGTAPFTVSQFMDMGNTTASGLNLILFGGEQGLLSMAFHPDYNGTTVPYFYLYYTNAGGNIAITRFETMPGPGTPSVVANTAAPSLSIMTISHPGQTNHNGGKLNFGSDGYLYFATGDGGGGNDVPNNAQNGNSLLGKMIRIDINNPIAQPFGNYRIPADNPYVADASVLDEIWALGLRNPFRWSFDRSNGNMWIGDVGQGAKEEVNFRASGSTGHVNYGWRCYEGSISTPGVADCTPADNVFPVFDYDNPASGSAAVTGGYVYRGTEYANFRGYYTAVDVYSGTLYILWPNGSGGFNSASQTGLQNFVVGFGEAEDGTLYAASQGTGTIYKVVATGGVALPVKLKSFTIQRMSNFNELKWETSVEQNTSAFHIEYGTGSSHFTRAGKLPASRNENGSSYSFQHYSSAPELFYRLAIEDDDGSIAYSAVLRITSANDKKIRVYPTLISNRILNLSLPLPATKLQLVDANGGLVFEKKLNSLSGAISVHLPNLAKGMYVVQIVAEGKVSTAKIIIN